MEPAQIVSRDDWLAARTALLAREKEFTHARDELSAARRALPWERMETDYVFDGPDGPRTLTELFDGRSQLMIYHFMMGPGWTAGCKSCSLIADHFDPAIIHLNQRDVSFVAVSRAPWEEIAPFKARMGWSFDWISSAASSFNRDFHVSFTDEEIASGSVYYNYHMNAFPETEAPGLSVFAKDSGKDGDGAVYHTYSTFGRGLDMFLTNYHLLDHAPKGRDEDALPYPMDWVRHHDRYGQK